MKKECFSGERWQAGFTIVELIVTMSMIILLSTIFLISSSREERRLALREAALQLAQSIREVQEMAMAAEEVDCQGEKTSLFGLYFDKNFSPNSYLIFADCNKNFEKDSSDEIIKEVPFNKKVEIFNLSSSFLEIVFVPPEPTTFINKSSQPGEAIVTLALKEDPGLLENQKKVKINTAGRIEIE